MYTYLQAILLDPRSDILNLQASSFYLLCGLPTKNCIKFAAQKTAAVHKVVHLWPNFMGTKWSNPHPHMPPPRIIPQTLLANMA